VQHLDGLEAERLDAVEHPLARLKQDGNDVEADPSGAVGALMLALGGTPLGYQTRPPLRSAT